MVRKTIAITAHYTPVVWGTKVEGDKVVAYAHYTRTDDSKLYSFYGDDADCYEEFDREGFTVTKTVSNFAEADEWIKKTVMMDC